MLTQKATEIMYSESLILQRKPLSQRETAPNQLLTNGSCGG